MTLHISNVRNRGKVLKPILCFLDKIIKIVATVGPLRLSVGYFDSVDIARTRIFIHI